MLDGRIHAPSHSVMLISSKAERELADKMSAHEKGCDVSSNRDTCSGSSRFDGGRVVRRSMVNPENRIVTLIESLHSCVFVLTMPHPCRQARPDDICSSRVPLFHNLIHKKQ
jgi:hypothetical protein